LIERKRQEKRDKEMQAIYQSPFYGITCEVSFKKGWWKFWK